MTQQVHIVCPLCSATNRLPQNKLSLNPKCGKCQKPLFDQPPQSLNSANFQKMISRNDTPVVIDFWAPWCAPCRSMAPAFTQAAQQLEPEVRLAKLNTEKEPSIGTRFAVQSIPTMIIFSNGKEIARQSGAMPQSEIVRWIKSVV